MFTPEEVIAAYRSKSLKPVTGSFHCDVEDGELVAVEGACCPLTALAVGATVDETLHSDDPAHHVLDIVEQRWPDVSPWRFMAGFDAAKGTCSPIETAIWPSGTLSYNLGVTCREALTKEFGAIGRAEEES